MTIQNNTENGPLGHLKISNFIFKDEKASTERLKILEKYLRIWMDMVDIREPEKTLIR